MNKFIRSLFMMLILGLMLACHKSNTSSTVRIVKDCTGTYLQISGKDYHVCNTEYTDHYNNGDTVLVNWIKINNCTGAASKAIVCMLLHPSEAWVEIKSIQK
jgi:hypothetical protein